MREAAYAWQLERDPGGWPKKKILQEYLNTIYFGNGAYGVQQAALTYFQHGAKDLTLAEAALLAGIPADPTRYDPVTNPAAARQRRAVVLQAMFEESMITQAAARAGERDRAARSGQGAAARHRGPGAALRQLRQAAADRRVRPDEGVRRRPPRADDDRPRAAADGARRDLEVADAAQRPLGRARRDRSARRRRPGDGRRQQLPQEPVQPGGAGRPAAGLVLQAVRARDRAARGNLACDALRVGATVDRPRRQGLGRRQLRRHLLREHRPREGDDRVGQLRLCAADAAGRVEEGGRDGEADGDPEQARRRTTRSGSARRR